jgi:hypothetical protein
MVEEVGELEPRGGLPEGKLQELFYGVRPIPQRGALAALI